MPGRAASVGFSVGFMASRPSSSGEPVAASADVSDAVATEKKLAAGLESKLPPDDDGQDDEDELELEGDEDDEELVVYTAKEAAGALATIYGFVKPFLGKYKKLIAFVGLGVLVETLFNVIMPLSLKFLIDDALGEEDFEALIRILSVLAVAGVVTSIVAIWYERLDARLAASLISDVRTRLFDHVQNLPAAFFQRTKRGEILSRFSVDMSAFEGTVKGFATSAALLAKLLTERSKDD